MEEKFYKESDVKGVSASGFKFPPSLRLKKRFEFRRLSSSGTKIAGTHLLIEYRSGKSHQPKLGITVTKKFGKAHDRFRFKRLVREAFRQLAPKIDHPIELNVRPRSLANSATSQDIFDDLSRLIAQTQHPAKKRCHNH